MPLPRIAAPVRAAMSVMLLVGTLATSAGATLPANFSSELVTNGLLLPVSMTFLPDGRMLILEKTGTIRIADPATLPTTSAPYLAITNIDSGGERGLIDIALDPDFANNNFFYVYYSAATPARFRVSRFTHLGTSADLASEQILWEDVDDWTVCCHYGGGLTFGPDGKLYVTTGEEFDASMAQDLSLAGGKILRINSDGSIPADNPFIGTPGALAEIWAYGLRNPFRAWWDFPTNRFFIGEVGGNNQATAVEDVHLGEAGANYGWPVCEGPSGNPNFPLCDPLLYDDPIFSYPHSGLEASLTGGFVYRGTQFPSSFVGSYFYGDFARGFMRYVTFDPSGTTTTGDFDFEDDADNIVFLGEGPAGGIYWINIAGEIRRITFNNGNQAPTITSASADVTSGVASLSVNFTSVATDQEMDPISYHWTFGDGSEAFTQNASHVYPTNGVYQAFVQVSDAAHTSTSEIIQIEVGTPPVATITAPVPAALFRAGDTVPFTGSATDDGALSNGSYSWVVGFDHNTHTHPAEGPLSGPAQSFSVPTSGHDFKDSTSFRFVLTVTDSDGLTDIEEVSIFPDKTDLTFETSPPGLAIFIDGVAQSTPYVHDTLIDFQHEIMADSQCSGGTSYQFSGWSDAGAQTHTITVPVTNTTLTATFTSTGPCTVPTSGLVFHLDAELGVTEATGVVTNWADQTAQGNDLVSSGDPGRVGAGLNGHDYVVFDGSGDRMVRTSTLNGFPSDDDDRSVFSVIRYRDEGAAGVTFGDNSLCNDAFGLVVDESGNLAVQGWCGSNDFDSGVPIVAAGWNTQSVVLENDFGRHFRNGTQIDSFTHTFATNLVRMVIGARIDLVIHAEMDVAEVLVYDRAVSEAERVQIENYFTQKYFTAEVCGNGVLEMGETCDDGNTANGDCCSATCQYELVGASCEDADACTDADTCDGAGFCNSGGPLSCDDGLFCSGTETCDSLLGCQAGTPINTDDGVTCTTDTCDEVGDIVVNTPVNSVCDDGLFCSGTETCDPVLDCQAGIAVNPDDGVACTTDTCDEVGDIVVNTPVDSVCDDQLFCSGAETCDPVLDCQFPDPIVAEDDGIACTIDSCDENLGVAANIPMDWLCSDGDSCTADSCDSVLGCQNVAIPNCSAAVPSVSGSGRALLALALVSIGLVVGGTTRRRRHV